MPSNHFDFEKISTPTSPRSVVTLPHIVPPCLGNPESAPSTTACHSIQIRVKVVLVGH